MTCSLMVSQRSEWGIHWFPRSSCPTEHTLELCWRQEAVACIYDDWQSIFEDLPDALNAQHHNGPSEADSDEEPHYPSEAAGYATANIPRGAG